MVGLAFYTSPIIQIGRTIIASYVLDFVWFKSVDYHTHPRNFSFKFWQKLVRLDFLLLSWSVRSFTHVSLIVQK